MAIAGELGLPLGAVERAALDLAIIPQRYLRNFKAYSLEQQRRLLDGHVFMVGLGGLGGTVLELLARAGVGRISAADGDVFEESNSNRQLLCRRETLGLPKSAAARDRVASINPAVELTALHEQLDGPRMLDLMQGADLVLDALGGLQSRPALWQAAQQAGLPMVSAAVAGAGGCVGSFFPGDPGPELLFGGTRPEQGAENTLGTQGPCVHLAASLQAGEAIRLLTTPAPKEGRILFFDLNSWTFEKVRFG